MVRVSWFDGFNLRGSNWDYQISYLGCCHYFGSRNLFILRVAFARSYQLKSPVIITRIPSISQVFLPIVPTRRPGWQLASGCCYCYYTPDNDSTHTHCWLHKSHDFSSVCSHVRLIFRLLRKAHVHVCWLHTQNRLGFMKRLTSGVAPCC
uniref:(northern house mosquito) hypothetical protein n=1 Tax=Culex pipiens TaxID=7175 RepID=A0A8D8N5Z7_CULPI